MSLSLPASSLERARIGHAVVVLVSLPGSTPLNSTDIKALSVPVLGHAVVVTVSLCSFLLL